MEVSNDKYDISLAENYKNRKIETKYRIIRKLSPDSEAHINVIVHYFINDNRVKFKIIEKDSSVANFNERTLSDMRTMTGQDALKIFIEGEIQYLKQMINSNLVEEIPKQKETLAKLKGAIMSKDNIEKIKLSDIEDGDKLEKLIELLPFMIKLMKIQKKKNMIFRNSYQSSLQT